MRAKPTGVEEYFEYGGRHDAENSEKNKGSFKTALNTLVNQKDGIIKYLI